MSDNHGVGETIRQLIDGHDFEGYAKMLGDLTVDQAMTKRDGWPYSMAISVAHTLYWQRLWLGLINDRLAPYVPRIHDDWPEPSANEWEPMRAELLAGLDHALERSKYADDLGHKLANGETVEQVLCRMVLHASYHLGQIALMRQLLGSWPPEGSSDTW